MIMDICRIKCGMANCYIVKGSGGAVLVDAGNPGDEAKIIAGLATHGIDPAELKLLLITHGHEDHFGAAAKLQEKFGIPTAMHPADSRPMPSINSKGIIGRAIILISRPSIYRQEIFRPDIELYDGQRLDDFGIAATVLHLPGHSAGSVCLLLDDGRLLCGDMYMNFFRPSLAHIFENYELMKASHEKLQKMDITTIYPGHGRPFPPMKA